MLLRIVSIAAILITNMLMACGEILAGEIEINVIDEDSGRPTAVRMHVRDATGRTVRPKGVPRWHDHFVFHGKIILDVRPGHYTFEVERGPEYRTRQGYFDMSRGAADNKTIAMQRFVNMKQEGWWSGDLFVQRPIDDLANLMLAEDLHAAPLVTITNAKSLWTERAVPEQRTFPVGDNRFFQVLGGRDGRAGGELLLLNLTTPMPLSATDREVPSSVDFLKAARRSSSTAHAAIGEPFAWDMPVWIASGMIDSMLLANHHILRDGSATKTLPGKPRDNLRFSDAHAAGRWSESIYYQLLNCGLRLPPSAGSGSGVAMNPVGYNRVYVHCGDDFSADAWWEGLKAGRVLVTNGPLLRPRVNGELPGHVFKVAADETMELQATLQLSLRERVEYLEIVKDGKVIHDVRLQDYAAAGGKLPPVSFTESGWMLIRAVTNNPKTYRYATTGPYYVQIGDNPRISKQAAQFFLDWVYKRAKMIQQIANAEERTAVMRYHRAARDFWQSKLDAANSP